MSTSSSIPELRLAICRRCRWPERRAKGAAPDDALLAQGRAWAAQEAPPCHVRVSQCLNCCDGGHTVRVEWRGREIALVGIRTPDELQRVLDAIETIAQGDVPAPLQSRVYQVWEKGVLRWHRNRSEGEGE